MDEDDLLRYLATCGGILVLLILILIISFDTVEPIEWGLKYNTITKSVDPDKSLYFLDYYLL